MAVTDTIEINGEEREIADAYAREQCAANAQNIATNSELIDGLNSNLSRLEYSDVAGGKNKIDASKIQYGFELDSTGQPTTKVGWYVTDYISVNPSTKYALSGISSKYVYEFDENKQFIKIIDAKSGVFETSATTKFIRLNSVANGYSTPQLEEGTTATEYEPYIPSVKMLADEVYTQNDSLANIDRTIGVEKIFNTYISSTDGSLKSSVDYITSGKINVTPNMYYNIVGGINGTGNDNYIRVASYKADGSFISRVDTIEDFVPSLECAYIRYFITNAYYDSVHIYSNDANNQINKNSNDIMNIKNDLFDCRKKSDITTNETLIGTFNGKNYYRRLFTGIGASGSSVTVNVGEKIEIYNYYGRAYTYGQSGASDVKYPIPNKNYYIDSQNASETSFQLTIPTSSDTRKVDLVIEYTKVDE